MTKQSLIYLQQLYLCTFSAQEQNAFAFNGNLSESLLCKDKLDTNTEVSTQLALDFIKKVRNLKI